MKTQYPPKMAAGAWQELLTEAALQAAKDKPWLLKLLAMRGAALATSYALWKERLERLRPGQRRRLQRRLGVSLAGAALLLALAAAPGLGAPAAAAPTAAITVTDSTGTIANNASCSLPEAIINANANNQSGSTDCTSGAAGLDTITLNTAVALAASNNSTYGPTGLPVVTSAITIEGAGNTISRSSGTFRIMAVGSGGDLTLNSATVSGGVATGSSPPNRGGGIYARSATVAVTNSTLSGNSASLGGGLFARSATVAVSNSTLSGNSAGIGGGGLFALSATLTVTNSTLSGNSSSDRGGGIDANFATVAVTNSTLSGNSSSGRGGGIDARATTVTVTNSTLSGNSAGDDGGGIYAGPSATLAVTNSTLSGNSASDVGGGLYARSATVAVTNSTLSGNSASSGGGIYAGSATVAVSRSLVSGNTAATGNEVFNNLSTVAAANYNLFGHGGETNAQAFSAFTPSGTDIIATSNGATPTALASILYTTLANNSGSTKTHALVVGGPAVDASPNTGCPATDQRGITRPVDVNPSGPAGGLCDIGAFEIQSTTVVGLLGMTAAPGGPGAGWWTVLLAGFGGLGLSTFVARRRSWRRRDSGPTPSLLLSPPAVQGSVPPPAYAAPAITQRSQLRQFSGSPLAVDPLNPLNLSE